jgi:membrane protease YdiL (CAAX protease family)
MARAKPQPEEPKPPPRGLLARPLDSLVFLLPMIVLYQMAVVQARDRVIAFDLLRQFFELFGSWGLWTPAAAVVVILLVTHAASGERWRVEPRRVGGMYLEAVALALPLLLLNQVTYLEGMASTSDHEWTWFHEVSLSVGAGIYEELIFRLFLVTGIMIVGLDILRQPRTTVAFVAVMISSVIFAGHHYQPIGNEVFALPTFLFRTAAGAYLAIIFWYRGYGPAAGCHAAYNLAVLVWPV